MKLELLLDDDRVWQVLSEIWTVCPSGRKFTQNRLAHFSTFSSDGTQNLPFPSAAQGAKGVWQLDSSLDEVHLGYRGDHRHLASAAD